MQKSFEITVDKESAYDLRLQSNNSSGLIAVLLFVSFFIAPVGVVGYGVLCLLGATHALTATAIFLSLALIETAFIYWRLKRRRALEEATWRDLQIGKKIEWQIDENACQINQANRILRCDWNGLAEIVCDENRLLLRFDNDWIVLPLKLIDEELKQFIVQIIEDKNVKVTDKGKNQNKVSVSKYQSSTKN